MRESLRDDSPAPAGGGSSVALAFLVALAVASPWAFGSVDPRPRFLLVTTALAASALGLFLAAAREEDGLALPDLPLWPLGALLGLGLLQLVPLPAPVLRLVSPASAENWYPQAPAARSLLGDGFRPVSIDPAATRDGLLLAAGLVGLGLLAVPALTRTRPLLRAAVVLTMAAALLAVYAILARNRFGNLLYGVFAVPTVSPFGPFVSKNHFAGYVGPALLVALGLALGAAGRAREKEWTSDRTAPGVVLALVAAMAMAASLFVSHSRGGAVAVVGGLAAFAALVLWRLPRSSSLLPAAIVGAVLVGLLALALPDEARARVTTLEGASFRLDTWRDGLRLAARSPAVGQGFGAFADAFPRAKSGHGTIRVEHAENEYVELLVEGGVLALGLALAAFFLPAGAAILALPRRKPLRRGLALGALAGLVALAVHSAFDFNLRIPSNATLAALLAAIAAAGAGLRRSGVGRAPTVVAALVFSAATIALLARGSQAFDRDAPWREVLDEVRSAVATPEPEIRALRAERATSRLEALLDTRPAFAEGWLVLAALSLYSGDFEKARDMAHLARALDPSRPALERAVQSLRVTPGK